MSVSHPSSDPSGQQRPAYCKCAFTDPDGTFVPGEACAVHPEVTPQREARSSKPKLEDFPHPQGGYSTMSFHNALIYWQEREIERLRIDNAALRKSLLARGHTESCELSMDSGFTCECGFEELRAGSPDETTARPMLDEQRRKVFSEHLAAAIQALDMRNAYRGPMSPDRAILTSLVEYLEKSPEEPSRDPYKAECEGGSGGRCTQPDCEKCWPDELTPENGDGDV